LRKGDCQKVNVMHYRFAVNVWQQI